MHHYRLHHDPRSSHQQIIAHVRRLCRQPVLDVGAAQGMLGKLAEGSGLAIDAVEPHPEWAEHARPYYREVFATSIEDAPLPERTYQVIVCGDVLEHTVDPVAVLNRLCRAATDDAMFIVSLPNVAHLAVRMMLLLGRFPKMERGILDKTHLHFFTRDTAEAMLKRAGLKVLEAKTTGVPVDELWKGGEGKALFRAAVKAQHLALGLAPKLFGFQWVFLAQRVPPSETNGKSPTAASGPLSPASGEELG